VLNKRFYRNFVYGLVRRMKLSSIGDFHS